jgi:hypothetical protein
MTGFPEGFAICNGAGLAHEWRTEGPRQSGLRHFGPSGAGINGAASAGIGAPRPSKPEMAQVMAHKWRKDGWR